MFGVLTVVACVIVPIGAVMFSGAPEIKLKIPPNCQRSTRRASHPERLPSNGRPGPNGISYVPLLVRTCVRWKPSRALFSR